MRQPKIEAPANPREKQLDLDYTEVEPHLIKRVEQLEKEGMTRAAARRIAELEEDQEDATHTPPHIGR